MAKVFFEETVEGETVLRNYTTTAGALPYAVRVKPGVGGEFWTWPSVDNVASVIGCDFTGAPVASTDVSENQTAISGITATPEDVLIWST